MRSPEDRELEQREAVRLVRLARSGDEEAFRLLVESRRDRVFRIAWNHLGNADDARAVAQSVFVRLWRSLDRYDDARPFDTWLHQVTVNAAIDHHRRRAAGPKEAPLDESFAAAPLEDPAETRELRGILRDLVASLPEKMRMAFLLREVEGLSTQDVAAALGTTESTVRNHILQARRALQAALAERHPEYLRRRAGRS